jgi:uncharacterized protein (TIRG00374 family)
LKRLLQLVVIISLTVFFLVLFLWKSDLRTVWAIMQSVNPWWIGAGFASNMVALFCRTARWQTILDPDDPPAFYPTFLANTIGYTMSTVLPFRASDLVRPAMLSRRTTVRFSRALGTVLTERVLDLTSILLLLLYFVIVSGPGFARDPATRSKSFIISSAGVGAAVLLAALWSFMIGLYFFRGTVRTAHQWLGRFIPARWRASWMSFFDSFVRTLDLAQNGAGSAKILFFTAAIWTALTAQFYFVVLSLSRHLPYDSSFFMTGVTTVGMAVPTPGGVGGFHKACQLVLTNFYGFDIDASVAVAVLFHLVGALPIVATGVVLSIREGLNWRQLTREAESQPRDPLH